MSIEDLMKTYKLFNHTFRARLEHRRYAVASECQDESHEHQIVKLKRHMAKIETVLAKKITNSRAIVSKSFDSSSSESENDSIVNSHLPTEYNKEKAKLVNQEKDIDDWMNVYIAQNQLKGKNHRIIDPY